MPETKIDRIVPIYMDGKVYARCYSGREFTDAVLSPDCLALMVSDGAKLLLHIFKRTEPEEVAAKAS